MGDAEKPSSMPPLVPEDYQWQQSPTDPSLWRRRAIGTENMVGIQPKNIRGQYDLFFSSTVEFYNNGLTLASLEQKIQKALLHLRFQHPEVAHTVSWDKTGVIWIQSQVTNEQEQLNAWARSTVAVEKSDRSAEDICDAIEKQRRVESPVEARSVTIFVAAPVDSMESVLGNTTIQFLFHVNHLYFDGISIRLLVGDLFRALGAQLSGNNNSSAKSGPDNLPPPVLDILRQDQGISGSEYETGLDTSMKSTARGMENWILPPDRMEKGNPRHALHVFSAEESSSMICNIKKQLGDDFNITHLTQAAVFLALLEMNPPGPEVPDSQVYMSTSPADGRRFLEKDYALGSRSYYPACVGFAPVIFKNIKSYDIRNANVESLVDSLSRACRVTKDSLTSWLKLPSYLPAAISFSNFLAHVMTMDIPPSTAPLFISDGVNEKWIPREVFDTNNQQKVLSLKTTQLLMNQYFPFFPIRLDSWRGCSKLCIDYNDGYFSKERVEAFLEKMTRIMLTFSV